MGTSSVPSPGPVSSNPVFVRGLKTIVFYILIICIIFDNFVQEDRIWSLLLHLGQIQKSGIYFLNLIFMGWFRSAPAPMQVKGHNDLLTSVSFPCPESPFSATWKLFVLRGNFSDDWVSSGSPSCALPAAYQTVTTVGS